MTCHWIIQQWDGCALFCVWTVRMLCLLKSWYSVSTAMIFLMGEFLAKQHTFQNNWIQIWVNYSSLNIRDWLYSLLYLDPAIFSRAQCWLYRNSPLFHLAFTLWSRFGWEAGLPPNLPMNFHGWRWTCTFVSNTLTCILHWLS